MATTRRATSSSPCPFLAVAFDLTNTRKHRVKRPAKRQVGRGLQRIRFGGMIALAVNTPPTMETPKIIIENAKSIP